MLEGRDRLQSQVYDLRKSLNALTVQLNEANDLVDVAEKEKRKVEKVSRGDIKITRRYQR